MPEGGQRSRWKCVVCKAKSGTRAELESQTCSGDPKPLWVKEAVDVVKMADRCKRARLDELDVLVGTGCAVDDDLEDITLPEQRPHEPVWSGEIVFCTVCGAYAESKAVKLRGECNGKPKFDGTYGGAWGQHRKLVNGRHPALQ